MKFFSRWYRLVARGPCERFGPIEGFLAGATKFRRELSDLTDALGDACEGLGAAIQRSVPAGSGWRAIAGGGNLSTVPAVPVPSFGAAGVQDHPATQQESDMTGNNQHQPKTADEILETEEEAMIRFHSKS